MTLGEKLVTLRSSKKMSQEQLAYEIDVSKTAIIKWEQDKAKPTIDNLLKLCDFYEVDFYSLFEDVSNINFSNAKIKDSCVVTNPNNSTINFNNNNDVISSLVANQNKLTELIGKQNELFEKLLKTAK